MSDTDGSDFDAARAEVFEALGHPNRIRILKALSGGERGFSELRRAVGMESSGLLSFHLQKLTHLVTTTPDGAYTLTDDGKEALRMAESIRGHDSSAEGRRLSRRVDLTRVVMAALLIGMVVVGVVAVYQQQEIASLNGSVTAQSQQIGTLNRSITAGQAGSVLIAGARYFYLGIPLQSMTLPTTIQFDGVAFNLTASPLGAGGLILSGSIGPSNVTVTAVGQGTGTPLTFTIFPLPNVMVKFADGQTENHSFVNSAGFSQGGTISISLEPMATPWFTSHSSPRAGFYLNSTSDSLELYVSSG